MMALPKPKKPKEPIARGQRAPWAPRFQFSPPDPLREGEGRPAAETCPAQQLGGGGRLNPVTSFAWLNAGTAPGLKG
jgi:hypothetical protein